MTMSLKLKSNLSPLASSRWYSLGLVMMAGSVAANLPAETAVWMKCGCARPSGA